MHYPPMRQIQLIDGGVAIIDETDYKKVCGYRWYRTKSSNPNVPIYAAAHTYRNGRKCTILMHREIMDAAPGQEVDHRFGDGLDNRRAHLRLGSRAQNKRGFVRKIFTRAVTSRFRGVSWNRFRHNWRASVRADGQQHSAGSYPTEIAAALAYNKKAAQLGFFPEAMNSV